MLQLIRAGQLPELPIEGAEGVCEPKFTQSTQGVLAKCEIGDRIHDGSIWLGRVSAPVRSVEVEWPRVGWPELGNL